MFQVIFVDFLFFWPYSVRPHTHVGAIPARCGHQWFDVGKMWVSGWGFMLQEQINNNPNAFDVEGVEGLACCKTNHQAHMY